MPILSKFDIEHLKNCVAAVNALSFNAPVTNDVFGRVPLQFNQATNAPPSQSTEKNR